MTNRNEQEFARSTGTAFLFLCGAVVVLMLSVLTFVTASEWFHNVSGTVFLALAGVLAYRGFRLLSHRHA